jgi:hypothetical protein
MSRADVSDKTDHRFCFSRLNDLGTEFPGVGCLRRAHLKSERANMLLYCALAHAHCPQLHDRIAQKRAKSRCLEISGTGFLKALLELQSVAKLKRYIRVPGILFARMPISGLRVREVPAFLQHVAQLNPNVSPVRTQFERLAVMRCGVNPSLSIALAITQCSVLGGFLLG